MSYFLLIDQEQKKEIDRLNNIVNDYEVEINYNTESDNNRIKFLEEEKI